MTKRYVAVIASVSGTLGMMIGVLLASFAWLQSTGTFASAGALHKTEAGIASKVALLEQMRAGRYREATRELEGWLDRDLVGAYEFVRDGEQLSSDTLRAIAAERSARGISGYQPENSSVSAAVREALRLAESADEQGATPATLRDEAR